MRIFIIGLSIIFFLLSGLITYRALEIPDYDFSYKTKPEKPVKQITQPEELVKTEPLTMEHEASKVQLDKLKATISELEEKLADNQKETAPKAETKETEKNEQVLAVLGGGIFRPGQVVVSEGFTSSVNELVQKISASPSHYVVIEGHTDNIPIKAYPGMKYQDNMDLSFLRANAIARILVENGISRERISVVGYGDTRPVASNDSNEGRARNRRVEVKLMPGEKEF